MTPEFELLTAMQNASVSFRITNNSPVAMNFDLTILIEAPCALDAEPDC